jgi:glucarate dehydratase
MRITELLLHPIAVADGPLRSSYGLHAPYALRTIVEIKTDDGIIGFSETYGSDSQLAGLEAIRDRVVGMDPFQLTRLQLDLTTAFDREGKRNQMWLLPGEDPCDLNTRSFAAIEIACLDAIGKAWNRPLCDLVGGRVRDSAPFSAYLFYKHAGGGGIGGDAREDEYGEILDSAAVVRSAKQMIAKYGFKEIKLKGGVLPPDDEIAAIKALREEFGPAYPLRIDPNSAWCVDTSVRVGRELKAELSDGGYLEDPCPGMNGMAEVRRRLLAEGNETPLASNAATTCFAHVPEARRTDGVQIVLSDPHYWGGIRSQQKLSDLCEVLGLGMSMHSNNHLGVSLMTMAHAAVVCPALSYACDTHYPWQTEQDEVVLGGRIPFVDGAVVIPDKPGLGIDLDYDQIARGRERYNKLPYRNRDDEAEMRRHVDPNWKRILPRW